MKFLPISIAEENIHVQFLPIYLAVRQEQLKEHERQVRHIEKPMP